MKAIFQLVGYLPFTFIHHSLDSVHRIKEVFALRVDAHSKFPAFQFQTFFQLGRAFPCARSVCDDYHRKFSLNYCLIDVHDAAFGSRQYLGYGGHDAWVVDAEN